MTTARDKLLALATDKNAWPYPEQVTNLLDAYRAEVLTEAAEMLRHAAVSPNETDGLDAAADLLLAARDTTS